MTRSTPNRFTAFTNALLFGTSATALAAIAAPAALAQEAVEDDRRLQTVTVTATKREQTLQDVPIAVSVVDEAVIAESQINDILDLQTVVPSLRVSQLQQSGNSTFIIRGFGNGGNNVGIEPSVAVFIDGVYRTRAAGGLSDYADISRIEVLRGPQSTLFGKNSSAGVINVVTEAPQFEFGGNIEGTIGNYNTFIGKGQVTGPISETLAFSLSGSTHTRDGYVDNVTTGNDINNRDRYAIKGQLLWEPNEDLSVRLIADYDELDELCCYTPNVVNGPTSGAITALGGNVISDPFGYKAATDQDPTNEISNSGFSAQVDYDTAFGAVTYIGSLRKQSLVSNADADFTNALLTNSNLLDYDIDTFTHELRIAGSRDKLDYLAGIFYFDEEVDLKADILYGPQFQTYADLLAGGIGTFAGVEQLLGVAPGTLFAANTGSTEFFTQENTSFSLFGQVDYALTDRLTATLGLAYIDDQKDVTGRTVNTDVFSSTDLAAAFNNPIAVQALAGASVADITLGQVAAGGVPGVDLATYQALLGGAALGDPTSVATVAAIQAGVQAGTASAIAGQFAPFQFLPPFVAFPNSVEDGSTSDDKVTVNARLAYDLNDNINLYGSYATGYKASSWNLTRDSSFFPADQAALSTAGLIPANRTSGTRFAGPEETTVFELGAKLVYPSFTLNVAIFDQTIEGFQSTVFSGTGFVLANAGEQSTTGVEFDALWAPTENLELTFAGILQDPTYDEFEGAAVARGSAADLTDGVVNGRGSLSGEQPAGIPETSLFFGAKYSHDFDAGFSGFIRGDYVYESDVQVVDNISQLRREVGTMNASGGLQFDSGIDLTVWVRNLNEDEYFTSGFPTTAQEGSVNTYANQPRTFGVTVRKTF